MTHMIVETANAEYVALEAFIEVMTPPPLVDYLAWAGENIVFSARESAFPGPYNRELFPYFDEILSALSPDDPCRTVTLQGSAQIGKTVVANIFTLGSIAMDPGDFLVVHPTEPNAKRWSTCPISNCWTRTIRRACRTRSTTAPSTPHARVSSAATMPRPAQRCVTRASPWNW